MHGSNILNASAAPREEVTCFYLLRDMFHLRDSVFAFEMKRSQRVAHSRSCLGHFL